ncbi:MAG: hypothetical protein AAF939_09945 [Planctomycetota bacterium]
MTYHNLSTATYWNEKVKKENRSYRNQRSRNAIVLFFQFLFCLAMIRGCFWAYENQDQWIPMAQTFFNSLLDRYTAS